MPPIFLNLPSWRNRNNLVVSFSSDSDMLLSLGYKRYYGQIRLPCRPSKISFPYIYRLPSCRASTRVSRVHCRMAPLRVTPVTPEVHLSVLVVFVRIDAPVFPLVLRGRQLHCEFRGYVWVRLRCDPQLCSTPLRSLCQGT